MTSHVTLTLTREEYSLVNVALGASAYISPEAQKHLFQDLRDNIERQHDAALGHAHYECASTQE